ncbi:MAG: beta-ketoacyl-ACP synthase III [Nitrospirota bacterium]
MLRSRIAGTGSYLPARRVTNEEVSPHLRLGPEAVCRRTGIRARHWAEEGQATSGLAEEAARRACEAAGLSPSSIEAVIVSTTSPDLGLPSTACLLQRNLKAAKAAAFDLSASCSGFLYGLSAADRLIRSGRFRQCLVVAAEIKSRFLNLQDDATAILFGDGAGAAVVVGEQVEGDHAAGIMGIHLSAEGARHDLIAVPAGGSRRPATAQTVRARLHTIHMRGGPLFRLAVHRLAAAVTDLLKEHGLRLEDVSQAVFHQANGRLLASLGRRLGLPREKLYSTIETTGNTSSASLPIALDRAVREGRLHDGDLVLLGTFGGGLTWAAALIRWRNGAAGPAA